MFVFILPLLFFGISNGDALNTFHNEMEAGAEWHHVGKQPLDPDAKQIDIDGNIYWKLKWKKEIESDGKK